MASDRELLERCLEVLQTQLTPSDAAQKLLSDIRQHLGGGAKAPEPAGNVKDPEDFGGPTLESREPDLGSPADYAGLRRAADNA